MTDKEILQNLDKLDMELPFDEIYVGDKYVDVHEVLSEIKERMTRNTEIVDWMHDDITWCRRTKCPNKECFRNQVNRRLKAGLISVADMYKEGKCPEEAE